MTEEWAKCDKEWEACNARAENGDDGCDSDDRDTEGAFDPNHKIALSPRFIPQGEMLGYTIEFENIGTVEARDVFLTDVLDTDLDLSTVQVARRLGGLEPLAPDEDRVDLPMDGRRAVERGRSTARRERLPGNFSTSTFSPVRPTASSSWFRRRRVWKPGRRSETRPPSSSRSSRPSRRTKTLNIVDDSVPIGAVGALPAVTHTPEFEVSWTGFDAVGEVERLAVYVSTNGGAYVLLETSPSDGSNHVQRRGRQHVRLSVPRT